jgi:ABC-type dipeptide/oligopeptide/nickel transport system ATPase component
VFTRPRHPYTALLMASAPRVKQPSVRQSSVEQSSVRQASAGRDRELSVHQLRRTAADPEPPPAAGRCVFAARCPFAADACALQPSLEPVADQAGECWSAACHRREEWPALAAGRSAATTPR